MHGILNKRLVYVSKPLQTPLSKHLHEMLTNRTKHQTSNQNSELESKHVFTQIWLHELKQIISTQFSYL